ncbi:hypothetical protein ACFFOP_15235 [Sinosporangium siamense]|uniref:hypothetical protein n=1 Tax=Sinosporangium siamense TaxID=1367973 RepID=UPI0035E66EEF
MPDPDVSPNPFAEPADFHVTSKSGPAVLGEAYTGRYVFTVSSGESVTVTADPATLPPGLTFSASGTISGTPTKIGTYQVPVRMCAAGICQTTTIPIVVVPPLTFAHWQVSVRFAGTVGEPATGYVSAIGLPAGVRIKYVVTDATALPPGITVTRRGKIIGTPTASGTFKVPVKMCAAAECVPFTLSLAVAPASTAHWVVSASYTSVPGQPVSGSITTTGTPAGVKVTYTITDPAKLPPGITVTPDGKITGTPTTAGTYKVPIKVCAGTLCANITIAVTIAKTRSTIGLRRLYVSWD